jgi:hypothetical protein
VATSQYITLFPALLGQAAPAAARRSPADLRA